jgi:Triosephosphate isomerase
LPSRIALGAQNLYPEKEGAFSGEVSPTMHLNVGCKYVILGHSERRHKLGESDPFITQKVLVAPASGLYVIFCVGETLVPEAVCGRTSDDLPEAHTRPALVHSPREYLVGGRGRHANRGDPDCGFWDIYGTTSMEMGAVRVGLCSGLGPRERPRETARLLGLGSHKTRGKTQSHGPASARY